MKLVKIVLVAWFQSCSVFMNFQFHMPDKRTKELLKGLSLVGMYWQTKGLKLQHSRTCNWTSVMLTNLPNSPSRGSSQGNEFSYRKWKRCSFCSVSWFCLLLFLLLVSAWISQSYHIEKVYNHFYYIWYQITTSHNFLCKDFKIVMLLTKWLFQHT